METNLRENRSEFVETCPTLNIHQFTVHARLILDIVFTPCHIECFVDNYSF